MSVDIYISLSFRVIATDVANECGWPHVNLINATRWSRSRFRSRRRDLASFGGPEALLSFDSPVLVSHFGVSTTAGIYACGDVGVVDDFVGHRGGNDVVAGYVSPAGERQIVGEWHSRPC